MVHFLLRWSALVLVWFTFMAGGRSALAQQSESSATLNGNVGDSTGSAIVGAHVSLLDAAGNVKARTVTNSEGCFSISAVSPGHYVLQVESKNFETTRSDVIVSSTATDQESILVTMRVATVRQLVNVEGQTEYAQTETSTATKIDVPVYETPLTIDSVTRGLFEDQGSRNLEQILRNVSTVQSSDSDAGWGAKTFQLRGFDLQNTLLQDGVRLPQYAEADPATIDHVDVLKGSSAGLYGRIEPGGVINIVTLKPQPVADYGVGLTLGPYGDVRTELDATGPLNASKSLLYRGILAYESANSYRDNVQTKHLSFVPSLQWNPRPHDRVDLRFDWKRWQDASDFGLPVIPFVIDPVSGQTVANRLPDLPRSVYIGPSENVYHIKTKQETVTWTHGFSYGWQVKSSFVRYDQDQPGTEGGPTGWLDTPATGWGTQTPTIETFYVGNPSNLGAHGTFAEVDFTGKFSTFKLRHSFLVGAEYRRDSSFYECWCYGSGTIDVTHPVYQPVSDFYTPSSTPPAFGYSSGNRWGSGTVQDQIAIGRRLRVLVGLRFDAASALNGPPPADPSAFSPSRVGDSKPSPRVGVSYDLFSWLAGYASYSDTFGGNSAAPLYNGRTSSAETSRQWEGGVKGHWLNGRLVGELTYFDLRKQHVVVNEPIASFHGTCTNPVGNSCAVQVGEVGSRGLEFQLMGRLASSWSVNLSYSNLVAKVLNSGDQTDLSYYAFPVGQRLANIPRNSGSAWLAYQNRKGWSAGFGAVAVGSRPFDQPYWQTNTTLTLPSHLILDAVVSYRWKVRERLTIAPQVKFSNLSNTNAWEPGWASSGVLPSEPRTLYGSIKLNFR